MNKFEMDIDELLEGIALVAQCLIMAFLFYQLLKYLNQIQETVDGCHRILTNATVRFPSPAQKEVSASLETPPGPKSPAV